MAIVSQQVEAYLAEIRPPRSQVMTEMEELAARDGIPIVQWETGRMLAALAGSLDGQVLEVGTAIGYSALHMAQALERGSITTLELDPERIATARGFLERAGVAEKVDIVEGDAKETLASLDGPFDLIFLDAVKSEYRDYLTLAESLASDRALLVVDNLLMSGAVADPDAETHWDRETVDAGRRFNAELMESGTWLGAVLPVGDGVGLATRI